MLDIEQVIYWVNTSLNATSMTVTRSFSTLPSPSARDLQSPAWLMIHRRLPPFSWVIHPPGGVDPQTGAVDRTAPFMVIAARPDQSGLYYDEPEVIAQFLPDERYARFQAEWVEGEGEWKFGKRVAEASPKRVLTK